MYQEITYDAVMKKKSPITLPPFWKIRGEGNSPLSGVPAYRYQQSLSCCITCREVCVQKSHAEKRINYRNFKCTVEDFLPYYCYTIKTITVEQFARKFGNLSLQAKERTWVNCKLIAARHQNCEPGSCAVWVSCQQINSL